MKKLLVCALAVIGLGASAPANPPDNVDFVAGSTQKICQVTGETDREFQKPTASQTTSRFGLVGTDLGYSFEHDGKLFFLFGDTIPSRSFNGRPNGQTDPPRLKDDNDSIGFTAESNIADHCPRPDFIHYPSGAYKNPVVLDAHAKPAITLGVDEVPIQRDARQRILPVHPPRRHDSTAQV